MKHRNPAAVFGLSIITLGIYPIVWLVKTKNEMKSLGAETPTAWLLVIPLVNLYWYWKYSQSVEKVTNKELSGVVTFILLIILGFIGMVIIQLSFNKLAEAPAVAGPAPVPAPVDGAPVVAAQPVVPEAAPPAPAPTPPVTAPTPPTDPTPPATPPATPPVV